MRDSGHRAMVRGQMLRDGGLRGTVTGRDSKGLGQQAGTEVEIGLEDAARDRGRETVVKGNARRTTARGQSSETVALG